MAWWQERRAIPGETRLIVAGALAATAVTILALVIGLFGLPGSQETIRNIHPTVDARRLAPAPPFLPLSATATGSPVGLYAIPWRALHPRLWPAVNRHGVPSVFLVEKIKGSWLQVYVPERPNGSSAWIRSNQVSLDHLDDEIVVHLARHTLVLRHGGRTLSVFRVADGAPATPTPRGVFFITELLAQPDPGGVYGPDAYGLSAFSDVFFHFDGGPGQIGIHGTNDPVSIGHSASNGCIRLRNTDVLRLVPLLALGTPVVIDK